ncbi:MAG: sugar ABC transporter permease [Chloroflexi bacterium HGW-Chloroflexi-5]|jgi:ribose/xylose/arabinose/galactoside ABC-type transport system permease subunit|nr:MAG: sugar ABC transporter permease [Chloroflexi bacterium HGW-Chloroflexi-5]
MDQGTNPKLQESKNKRRITNTDVQQFLLKGRAFIALILVLVVFTSLSPQFVSPDNIVIITKHVAINAILAIGMTFVILSGGIDLSVGSIVGLTAMIAGGLINEGIQLPQLGIIIYPHTWMIVVISLAIGTLMGTISGFIITRFNVAPFIATMGMLYVARGLAGLRNNGYTFPNIVGRPEYGNTGFQILGAGDFLGVNYSIWIMVAFSIIAYIVTTRMAFGRHVYAIGGNERAAELSGVRINKTKIIVYSISGFCSATVGLIIASQLVAAHPLTGDTFELTAIAAVVLGGTSLAGGRGSIGGTLIGAFVIGVLGDGLIMMGVSSFWQKVIKGAVIVLAVIIDQVQARMQDRIALQKQQEIK